MKMSLMFIYKFFFERIRTFVVREFQENEKIVKYLEMTEVKNPIDYTKHHQQQQNPDRLLCERFKEN